MMRDQFEKISAHIGLKKNPFARYMELIEMVTNYQAKRKKAHMHTIMQLIQVELIY